MLYFLLLPLFRHDYHILFLLPRAFSLPVLSFQASEAVGEVLQHLVPWAAWAAAEEVVQT